jgi:hypothetical protein
MQIRPVGIGSLDGHPALQADLVAGEAARASRRCAALRLRQVSEPPGKSCRELAGHLLGLPRG